LISTDFFAAPTYQNYYAQESVIISLAPLAILSLQLKQPTDASITNHIIVNNQGTSGLIDTRLQDTLVDNIPDESRGPTDKTEVITLALLMLCLQTR
jgi:uncharacterized protein (DUF608 family)